MAQLNKTCLCCSIRYSYCPSCSRADKLAPTWKSEFCSEPCMTLWTTLTKYNMNMFTKAEAKSIISDLDLKPIDAYVACVKRDYDKVMAEDKKPKRGKRIEIKPVDEVIEIEQEVVESILEDNQFIVKVDAEIKNITEDEIVVEVTPRKKAQEESHEVVEKENE